MLIDFDSFEAPKKGNGQVVFVRGKNCPITFKPVGGLLKYEAVFDSELKRNRRAKPGERATTRYLVNGLDPDGNVKAYDLGSTVVTAIKEMRATLASADLSPDVYLTVTAKGTGTDTVYGATYAKALKEHNGRQIGPAHLLDLAKIATSLVVGQSTDKVAEGLTGEGRPFDPESDF